MIAQRGSVLVESAVSLLILCAVLYGTLQLGVVVLNQITSDGAAFVSARQQALNATEPSATAATVTQKTQQIYPGVAGANIQVSNGEPPTAEELTNYGLSNANARHGGFSLVQPVQAIANVSSPLLASLTLPVTQSAISLVGVAAEPAYLEFGVHEDLGGTSVNSLAGFNGATDYFTHGENTPPYFVGFHYMTYCPNTSVAWTGCPSAFQYEALGVAEYLDVDNWSRANPGIQPAGVFEDLRLHQNTYAAISTAVASETIDQLTAANPAPGTSNILNWDNATVRCMYSTWDSRQAGGYPNNYTSVGQYPLHPDSAC